MGVLTVLIDTVDKSEYFYAEGPGDLSFGKSAGGLATCTLRAKDYDGAFRPSALSELVIKEAGSTIWGGVIQRYTEDYIFGAVGREFSITATDYSYYLDKVHITEDLAAGQTLKQVLTTIVTYLSTYGITLDAAQGTGPTLDVITWSTKTASECLKDLNVATGWVYVLSSSKVLRMHDPASLPAAPYSVSEATPNCVSVKTDVEAGSYYNRIILACGTGTVFIETEAHAGDGVSREFFLDFPAAGAPVHVRVVISGGGTTDYPLGEYGVDDMPYTYDDTNNSIHQRVDQPLLVAADTLSMMGYTAVYPFTVVSEDAGEIAAWKLHELVATKEDCFDLAAGQSYADGVLRQCLARREETHVELTKATAGIAPPELLTIDLADRGFVSDTFMVESVESESVSNHQIERTVKAVKGTEYSGQWYDKFRDWSSGGGGGGVVSVSGSGGASTYPTTIGLGGSRNQAVFHGTASTWIPVYDQATIQLNSSDYIGRTLEVRVIICAVDAGVTVHARLRKKGGTESTAGEMATGVTGTTPTSTTFSVTLVSGDNDYELEVKADAANAGILAIGFLRIR